MAQLIIDANNVDTLISAIKNSKSNIDTSVNDINNPSKCSGIMITSYVDRIKKISKLLESYKQLMERDAVDIVASKDKIVEMDRQMKKLY